MCIRDRLHPSSKSTKAFARRETRQGEDPSRASAVSALRSFSLRNPDCIMPATESARSKNARNFYRLFNESGYTNKRRLRSKLGCAQGDRSMNINAKPARRFANYVNGEDQDGRQGETFESINPTTGAAFGRFVESSPADVDAAVQAA